MIELEIIKWSGTLCMAISAVLVSFSMKLATKWWPFTGFLLGHILWTYGAFVMNEPALFYLNVAFIFVDIRAIMIRINNSNMEKYNE